MYESTILAEALSVKSEIISLLEDRGYSYNKLHKFYESSDINEKLKKQLRDLVKKYNTNVDKIGIKWK